MKIAALNYTAFPSTQPVGAANAAVEAGKTFWGQDGFSFESVLDLINPLQQIPVISNIYRALTGDVISPGSRLAGGALYGGPIGFMASLVGAVVEGETGQDVGSNMIAMLTGQDKDEVQIADNSYTQFPLSILDRQRYAAYQNANNLS